jgi:Cof subfamily protein (haloacid dehalogenase superfamily)
LSHPDLSPFQAVVLDIDGTLARPDSQISAFTMAVVRLLAARGPKVIISTGRSESNALRLSRELGTNAPVISCNGAVVTDPASGRRLRVKELTPAEVRHYLSLGEQPGLESMIWTAGSMLAEAPSTITQLMADVNEYPITIAPRSQWPQQGVVKVLMAAPAAVLDELDLTGFPLIQRSLAHFVEATAANARKDLALAELLAHLGIEPAVTLAFGDAETDLASLQLAGLGVAVAGGAPSVTAAADLVIGDNADDAVAHFLNTGFSLGVAG